MADNSNLGFGKFVPGFDFLQNIAKGATQTLPQMPSLSSWIAPTLNVEELEKRISELKAVHFWLDQNSKALAATVQALEVQKMTLATLKGMNFNMAELADAMKLKGADGMFGGMQKMTETAADAARAMSEASSGTADKTRPARKKTQASQGEPKTDAKPDTTEPASAAGAKGVVDPLQWWGALTQQFQQIASSAMKDVASQTTAMDAARNMATAGAKVAPKTEGGAARKAPAKRPARKKSR